MKQSTYDAHVRRAMCIFVFFVLLTIGLFAAARLYMQTVQDLGVPPAKSSPNANSAGRAQETSADVADDAGVSRGEDREQQLGLWRAANASVSLAFWQIIISAGGLIFLGWTLLETRRVASASVETARQAAETLKLARAGERPHPYVSVDVSVLENAVRIEAAIRNAGRTPAFGLVCELWLDVHNVNDPPEHEIYRDVLVARVAAGINKGIPANHPNLVAMVSTLFESEGSAASRTHAVLPPEANGGTPLRISFRDQPRQTPRREQPQSVEASAFVLWVALRYDSAFETPSRTSRVYPLHVIPRIRIGEPITGYDVFSGQFERPTSDPTDCG